jgi:transaldolase
MPEKTLRATTEYDGVVSDGISPAVADAHATVDALEALGVSLSDVTDELERDGVAKFVQSWRELVKTVSDAMESSV